MNQVSYDTKGISKIATPIAEVLAKLKKPNHVVMLYEIKKRYKK